MLTLFSPQGWHSGADLKDPGQSWKDKFDSTEFFSEAVTIMMNMNVMYECLDARHDHHGTSRNGVREYDLLQSHPPISLECNNY